MASTLDAAPAADANRAFAVEQNGINLIPDAERQGKPSDLFWIWFGANLVLTFIISGYLLANLGLSTAQMLGVVLSGNLLFLLVGYGGIPGARVGTATLVISRAAFGRQGNIAPSILSWLTVVGWEAVNLALGGFALFSLFELMGLPLETTGKAIALVVLAAFTFGVAILGHATILVLQKVFTWALGLIMLGLIPQVWAAPQLPEAIAASAAGGGASFASLCIAFTLVAALPISFTNYPADYARYLPKNTSAAGITLWTFIGSYVPTVVLTIIGFFAAKAANLADPVGGFQPILASWYFQLFVFVVLGGTITNNFLNTYSSGLSLLAVGLNVSRPAAILIDAILATSAAAYAIFFHDFTSTFIAFLSLMVAWLAPWAGVYLADIWLRNSNYRGADLLSSDGGIYRGWHAPGFVAWIAGCIAALMCTSADLFKSPFAEAYLGGADFSIVAGFLVSALLYVLLAGRSIRATV